MNLKKTLSLLTASLLLVGSIPFSAGAAAAPEIIETETERIALVSAFGKMAYDGKSCPAYKSINDAVAALGDKGGKIIFNGTLDMSDFQNIENRAPITFEGTGANAQGNLLDFKSFDFSLHLKGDLAMGISNLRTAEDVTIYTDGHNFETYADFDTYHYEKLEMDGPTIIGRSTVYPAKPSVAFGEVKDKAGVFCIDGGHFNTICGGSMGGYSVNADTDVIIKSGVFDKVVAGNIGSGTTNGNVHLTVDSGTFSSFTAGSEGGVVNGNLTTIINGGNFTDTVLGPAEGATINGCLVFVINGGVFSIGKNKKSALTRGTGTVNGKTVIVLGDMRNVSGIGTADYAAADYAISLIGGSCQPKLNGNEVEGFLFTDNYGAPAQTITLNGKEMTSETGVYTIPAGLSTVKIKNVIEIGLNPEAKYVAGYEDGTFRPQNNITRAEAITLLSRLVTDENTIKGRVTADYKDVAAGSWYEGYIGFFQKLGFLDKLSKQHDTEICPTEPITRGEFVQLIFELSKLSKNGGSAKPESSMPDVTSQNPYAMAIYYAVSEGIVTGYEDGTFRPKNNITRAEVVTIVNRFLGRTPTGAAGNTAFGDIGTHWAKDQILAACGTKGAEWNAAESAGKKYTLTGNKAEDYVKGLYNMSSELSAQGIRDGIDVIAEQMKKDILGAKDELVIKGTKYYFSEKGDDENDGLSPEKPKKSLNAVNTLSLKPGDGVLFERGSVFRGSITVSEGVSYGAYGTGDKPVLMQSKRNYADPEIWVEMEKYPGVYKCRLPIKNAGVVVLDRDVHEYSDYDALYCDIENLNSFGFKNLSDFSHDLEFYSNLTGDAFYFYSTEGNPGERFKDIEIGEQVHILSGSANDVTIDNLSVMYTGAHGMSCGTTKNRVVTNCVFQWLGGSVLWTNADGSATNYGNAVEIYGGCNGYRVENNWMYQIYDTGVTHQYSDTAACTQEGVRYYGNLIEYSFWGIEFYNAPPTEIEKNSKTKYTRDVHIAYNVLRDGGYGWGSTTRHRTGQFYCGSSLAENYDEKTEFNIFDRCSGYLLNLPWNANEVQDSNIYVQTVGKPLGSLRGVYTMCDFDIMKHLKNTWGDKNPVAVLVEE